MAIKYEAKTFFHQMDTTQTGMVTAITLPYDSLVVGATGEMAL